MRLSRIQSLAAKGVGFDTETALIQPGLLAPPMVCASVAWLSPGPRIEGMILDKQQGLETFAQAIEDESTILVGANIAYDLLVVATELAKRGIDAMPAIFKALEEERVYDLQIAEALHAVACGHLNLDPRTGGGLKDPASGKRGRYSLSICTDLVLGRGDAKANDSWRLRYAELADLPMSEWPQSAIDYPIDDSKNTIEVALSQSGHLPKVIPHHDWVVANDVSTCRACGSTRSGGTCMTRKPHLNLLDLSNQVATAFVLHLGAAWGFQVDQKAVDLIENHALRNRERGIQPFIDAGIIREDGTEDRSVLKKMVAVAYGATEPCPHCNGTGKIPSPASKPVRCAACRGRCVPWKAGGKLKDPTVTCDVCANTGLVPNPNPSLINCVGEDGVKTCDGTGLILGDETPRSDKDGISFGRDTLYEAADEALLGFASFKEDEKVLKDYVPYLREARVQDPISGLWSDIPLTLKPNVLLESGRSSYSGYIQLFPRKPGFFDKNKQYIPSLREAIVARPGRIFSSEDFKVGELYAHAQNAIWLLGASDLATALLKNVDPHAALAATVLGVSYDEFIKRKKEKRFAVTRQSMKPFSFGRPAGMSAAKIVLAQRKAGPDTICVNGPSLVDDGTGTGDLTRGYKGLRFCIAAGATSCGSNKTRVLKRRGYEQKIPPTCTDCLEYADHLGKIWLHQWRENQPYFDLMSNFVEHGMQITAEMLERWPHWKEYYYVGQQLEPGQIAQSVSGRLRSGLDFCAMSNSLFQGLVADITKAAARRVARECYVQTRVVEYAHANSVKSKYAGCESPLYGSRLVAFYHDELFLDHPEPIASDAAERVSEVMLEEMQHYLPDLAPTCGAEPTLMRRWSKAAECVRDSSGRLQVWEPKS